MMKPTMLTAIMIEETVVGMLKQITVLSVIVIYMNHVLQDSLLLQLEMACVMLKPILKIACLMD